MSFVTVAERSGVSLGTVRRILVDQFDGVSLANVLAVARALGVELQWKKSTTSQQFLEQAAEVKARRIVGTVQATSGLEVQAVDDATAEQMVRQTVHELMAGPRSRIWATH